MRYLTFLLISLCLVNHALAGVMPSHSRVVYEENSREKSLMLANTNNYPVVVQTWVDKGEGTPDSSNIPFVTIPPVFRLEPQGIKGIRIIYNHSALPRDRESLYWFNIYEIPPEKKGADKDNSVLVTMNTQIKLFYRPAGLHITPEEAIARVSCQRSAAKTLRCHNPSPLHLSIIAVELQSSSGPARALDSDLLIAPLSDKTLHFDRDMPALFNLNFRYINDAGDQLTSTSQQ